MSAFGTSFGLLNAAMFAGFLSRVVPGVDGALLRENCDTSRKMM